MTISEKEMLTVINPEVADAPAAERFPLASRPDTLDGKTVYLIDVGFGGDAGGYSLLTAMQRWLAENRPRVKTVLKRKTGNFGGDAPDVWEEIKANGDAMIMAVGH